MKKTLPAMLVCALIACGSPRQYQFELTGEIVEGNSEEATFSLDMYQDACDSDIEVFTSAVIKMGVEPILVSEPGQASVENDLYVYLDQVRIVYTARPNALGNSGSAIAEVTLTDVSQRDLKVNAQNETGFLFLTLDQKAQWRDDQGGDTGETYLYDYEMTLTFALDADGEDTQEETFNGTVEMGHFDKCD